MYCFLRSFDLQLMVDTQTGRLSAAVLKHVVAANKHVDDFAPILHLQTVDATAQDLQPRSCPVAELSVNGTGVLQIGRNGAHAPHRVGEGYKIDTDPAPILFQPLVGNLAQDQEDRQDFVILLLVQVRK